MRIYQGAIKTFNARIALIVDLLTQGKMAPSCAACQGSGFGTGLSQSPLDPSTEAL